MEYRIELIDAAGRRVAWFDEAPLLEAERTAPDAPDVIRGMLPADVQSLAPGYRVRVLTDGELFCEGVVTSTAPSWGDSRRLVLDRYVNFHEVVAFEARGAARRGNTAVAQAYANQRVSEIVKDAVNRAPGAIHYYVQHDGYPEGAQREYGKFLARKTAGNELEGGGIASGQWVGAGRIDASGAYAKDGDTIAGLEVDGVPWPDVRLMMIDAEETSLNSHAMDRHPEVANWDAARYAASGYALRAEAAKDFLQALLTEDGIDYLELNPHVDASGGYDDRVDAYGRYIGLVYGGGKCWNAALVEQGLADVYLYDEGRYHDPSMALKDYYSYTGVHGDSVVRTDAALGAFDAQGGVLEVLTALAYAAPGHVWTMDAELGVSFRAAADVDRVVYFDAPRVSVQYGTESSRLVNWLSLSGHPLLGAASGVYARGESIDAYGVEPAYLSFFSLWHGADLDQFAEGLLDDLAYPAASGCVTFLRGDSQVAVGDLVALRGEQLRRLDTRVEGEWGGRFGDGLVGRVSAVRHRLAGRSTQTEVCLTSPLRTVENPLSFMVRRQASAEELYAFRLDEETVGLDLSYHLD